MFTPSPMKFVLSQFDTTITLGTSAIYETPEDIPPIDTSAVAIIYVNPNAFARTFWVSRNENDPNIPNSEYINRYYTLPFYFNNAELFGANNPHGFINAMMDASYTNPSNTIHHISSVDSMKTVTNWNGKDKNNLIPHDFMYYLVNQLFDIPSSETIDNFVPFRNKSQLIADIRTKCNFSDPNSDIFKNILTNTLYKTVFKAKYPCDSGYGFSTLNNGLVSPNPDIPYTLDFFSEDTVYGHPGLKLFEGRTAFQNDTLVNKNFMTDDVSNNTNICRTIYKQMLNDGSGARFLATDREYPMTLSESSIDMFNATTLPFIRGDSISFKLTINPAENQHLVTGRDTPIPGRSYEICMILDEDYLTLNTPVP